MFVMSAKNFRDAYFKLNNYLFFNNNYDHVRGGVTAHSFHNELRIETAECDLNMSDINYTMSKWNQLIKLYLDPVQLGVMVARLLHYATQTKHKNYVPDIGMHFKERRNVSGACLMALTIGYNEKQGWHAEVFSRASELTMRWYVDLIFVHVLIREIGKYLNFEPKDIRVYWHMVSTYQSITSMPWFLVMAGKEDWLVEKRAEYDKDLAGTDPPRWWTSTVRRYVKTYLQGDYQNFRVQRRPMEAYLMAKGEMERKTEVLTENLTLPDIDINQQMEEADEEDLWGKGGYR